MLHKSVSNIYSLVNIAKDLLPMFIYLNYRTHYFIEKRLTFTFINDKILDLLMIKKL